MITAYIALGSNLGDSRRLLASALAAMVELADCELDAVSPTYRSCAVGPGEQRDYLNLVARLRTALPAVELLSSLQQIESNHGRERREHWGARTLDLDILLYDNAQVDTPELVIPHPRMAERNFVLYPLSDLAPDLVLPCGTPLQRWRAACSDAGLEALGDSIEPGR
jgi:2-amino-4-hydroxy-6-hydroxymethyldihydropteridine diphosphokinase